MTLMRRTGIVLAGIAVAAFGPNSKDLFQVEEVGSVAAVAIAQLKPRTIAFTDHRTDELADPATGLIRFEDWARARPLQKQNLSLYPGYVEPTLNVTANGVTKQVKEKLQVYVAEARFIVAKAPGSIELGQYATLPFVESLDPAITHKVIAAADAIPLKDPEAAHLRHPDRRWCEAKALMICIQSHYKLEGKLPVGIRLANKLAAEGDKKVADFLEFQSELRVLAPAEIDQPSLTRLTGLNGPVTVALEQTIFHVNQILRFGKFLAVLQPHPSDPGKTVVTTFIALAIKAKVLETKKEYEGVPVLRNLVPAQVLVGNSSFNTGSSISAGLPSYARNRIKAIAGILER